MVNNDVDLVCSSTDGNPGGRIAGWKRPLHVAEVQRLHIAHMSDVPRNKKEKKKKKEKKRKWSRSRRFNGWHASSRNWGPLEKSKIHVCRAAP
jgi:hypothetical protein